MDIIRNNSSNLGSGIPTRFPTHENWNGGILHMALRSHFTKTPVLAFLGTNKIENPFLCGKTKIPSYKSRWPWKYAQPCQKWDQDSKDCYGTCTNHGQLGRKPSEVLFGGIFCEEFFSETLVCHVWYFSSVLHHI
jgi:hypothetical protein